MAAERRLGSMQGGIEQVDQRTSSQDCDVNPSHRFGDGERFGQAQKTSLGQTVQDLLVAFGQFAKCLHEMLVLLDLFDLGQ